MPRKARHIAANRRAGAYLICGESFARGAFARTLRLADERASVPGCDAWGARHGAIWSRRRHERSHRPQRRRESNRSPEPLAQIRSQPGRREEIVEPQSAGNTSAQLLLYGYTGDLSDTLPNWQSFDVTSYADYLKSVSALHGKVFGDPTKMRPVLLSSTLATTLKPAKGTTITRAGAMPASDVHEHRLRVLISKHRLRALISKLEP